MNYEQGTMNNQIIQNKPNFRKVKNDCNLSKDND
jgi:hypothetical protein